jgi:hypothetical protein
MDRIGAHALRMVSWLAVAAALAACGAGVGGTGTGTGATVGALDDFGAAAAPLCGASFAASLNCPAGTGASAPSTPAIGGTAPTRWVDVVTGGQLGLRFDGNRVTLDARCQQIGFEGEWGVTPAGAARFYGSSLADGSIVRLPAVLEVQAGATRTDLVVTLRDGGGALLLGPTVLRGAAEGDPAPAACP